MKPIDFRGTVIAVSYSTTVDILTDVLSEYFSIIFLEFKGKNELLTILSSLTVMALPFKLLYTVKITTKQKLGLAGVFGIATIIIVVAIVRAVEITTRARTDAVLLTVWSIIESTVCKLSPPILSSLHPQ